MARLEELLLTLPIGTIIRINSYKYANMETKANQSIFIIIYKEQLEAR